MAFDQSFKVLAIGNSFSEDSLAYLYDIARDYGIREIIIANLYIPGASLQDHWNAASQGQSSYDYQKNKSGKWHITPHASLLDGLTDEAWDIITFQQASGYSGRLDSIEPYLSLLLEWVQAYRSDATPIYAWHMTWAYQADSTHEHFAFYHHDQSVMYRAILDVVRTKILPLNVFHTLIPTGTAIQKARKGPLGDTLTRDGYHLSLLHGRYIAGLTWFKSLTKLPIESLTYVPYGLDRKDLKWMKRVVNQAIEHPFDL
ncbi:MAG TPA: DUF4886 domain-containing protein [Haloplasmataceae bacterium]